MPEITVAHHSGYEHTVPQAGAGAPAQADLDAAHLGCRVAEHTSAPTRGRQAVAK
ncbi:hypothetical protein IT779_25510 [Nocardia sp. NEAU-351]|uniref:Uncharacterized protein n=2 Tax=Nocardia bovistercoris TaxID=2785916 RepID=A0A931N6F5_9NOCA|nr:hypothetical protein [Nocardia bovistercoris]